MKEPPMNPIEEDTLATPKAKIKHSFYLNIEHAYIEAEKQQKVLDESGKEELQYCYYEGALTDIILPNFIQVSQSEFVDFFSNNQLPIPTQLIYKDGNILDLEETSPDIIEDIVKYRKNLKVANYIHKDSYFIDELEALNTAKQKNRVFCGHPTIDGLQVCYVHGSKIQSQINNFIRVDINNLISFFLHSRLRLPQEIVIPDALDNDLKVTLGNAFKDGINQIPKERNLLFQTLLPQAKEIKPDFINDIPLRVFLPASRLTTVMQYSTKGIARAFNKLGYKTLVNIESSDMEGFNPVILLQKYIDFKAHITVNINHLNNYYQHQNVINFVWYQDPMPEITRHKLLPWRENDLIFSNSPQLDSDIKQCGGKNIIRQHFSIDSDVFNDTYKIPREDKIVFIGSSYSTAVNLKDPEQIRVISLLTELINNNVTITEGIISKIAKTSTFDYIFILHRLFSFVTRDYSVKWLCQNIHSKIEIYGFGWNINPNINRYYKGELSHGKDVAKVYNSAKYALVTHPFSVNSQRLAEVVSCGCIPIVYDCRGISEKPHWDEYCLFFKKPTDLTKIINKVLVPDKNPLKIAKEFSYTNQINQFIKHQKSRLKLSI